MLWTHIPDFSLSLAQFFAESKVVELTPELKELFNRWMSDVTDPGAKIGNSANTPGYAP